MIFSFQIAPAYLFIYCLFRFQILKYIITNLRFYYLLNCLEKGDVQVYCFQALLKQMRWLNSAELAKLGSI